MTISLYDTLTRADKPLRPLDGDSFRFYCCGPTVYGPAHIGNFRTFVVQDVLRRTLEVFGLNPTHVRNITDVDDKTICRSQEEQLSLTDFTQKWTQKFHEDCTALNLLPPHYEPAATEFIQEQVTMIQDLVNNGHAYVADDGSVYFKVASFTDYGKLTHLDKDHLETQSTNSAGCANHADEYDRESVADFALWKSHKPEDGPNSWESPWGPGRPGWHIECSAMAKVFLGDTFDLHAGGIDLCFPHHENEIAQSEGANQKPFCEHWFHSAHLQVDGHKMSKSLGNLYTLEDIKSKGFSPRVLRYLLISGHYHQPLNFTFDGLHAAESALHKLEKFANWLNVGPEAFKAPSQPASVAFDGPFQSFWSALAKNLNVPQALGQLFQTIKALEAGQSSEDLVSHFESVLYVLGLQLFAEDENAVSAPESVLALAEERLQARKNKDFQKSDELRDQIKDLGWNILDKKDNFDLEPIR